MPDRAGLLVGVVAAPMLGLLMMAADAAAAHHAAPGIPLASPVHNVDPLPGVHLRKDRRLRSVVPGPVDNLERVVVGIGASGAPARVTDTQRLRIVGAGNYIVRELGPARAAAGLGGTTPPVLELGQVVWQGFSPDTRELRARLTLDPGIEAARLPMSVRLAFRDLAGRPGRLGPGARAPVDGTVTVTLTNATSSPRSAAVGAARVGPLARLLDRLRLAAAHPRPAVPPVAGAGLPRILPGQRSGTALLPVTAPLRVTGTVSAPGGAAAVTGPGTSPTSSGARIAGTLTSTVSFVVRLAAGDALGLHLDVRPWLDPRTLQPPAPARTWRQWAASHPTPAAVHTATQTAVTAAATAARSAEYSPYLQADTPGRNLSTFTYVVATAPAAAAPAIPLRAHPGAIAATVLAVLAVAGNAAALHRRL